VSKTMRTSAARQSGAALIVVLLLLLVITVLGLAAMRGTVMQERMSGNTNARAKAFQFAEAVLREAETVAASPSRPPIPATGCANGMCAMVPVNETPAWESPTFWTSASNGFRVSGVELQDADFDLIARYVIEDMGEGNSPSAGCTSDIDMSAPTCAGTNGNAQNFRITAYARLGDGAEVALQSGYQVP